MYRPFSLFVSLRYLRVQRRNRFVSVISLISILGITIGVAALITVLSVMNGFDHELRKRIVGMTAEVTVSSFSGSLAHWKRVARVAQRVPGVRGMAPVITGQAMLAADGNLSGARIEGIEPAREVDVLNLARKLVAGRLNTLSGHGWNIILGRDLAYTLGVTVGNHVVLMVPEGLVTPTGLVPRVRRFRVSGIFDSGDYAFDSGLAFIGLRKAQRLFGLGTHVSALELHLDHMLAAPAVARTLVNELHGNEYVSDWISQNRSLFQAIATEKRVMFFILLLIVAVAAFNIISTLVMVVNDKAADIAILRTMGASPGTVLRVFVLQGAVIGVLGTLVGLGLGILLAHNVQPVMQFIHEIFHVNLFPTKVYFINRLPSRLEGRQILEITLIAFGLTVLSTLYPAWRASRVLPVEALRHE
ncbi:MAG: lipoprotein-releasing ABC transporter permease subunit [Gammaproteobacteria bacterium]